LENDENEQVGRYRVIIYGEFALVRVFEESDYLCKD
jgi:hypothetical protein